MIIDAHVHLWKTQRGAVNGRPVVPLGGGRCDFGGEVPDNIDDLQCLPGVGRKTANVIAAVVFDQPAMPVDTHVFRVANRIGLTHNSKTPLATERTLVEHIPSELLPKAHHWLILHGRYVCQARKPKCEKCFLTDLCKTYQPACEKGGSV